MVKEIYGVKIPSSLENDPERATAYAAGWIFYRVDKKVEKMPQELREVGREYRNDLERSDLQVPQISRVESSFWAGYLISVSSGRDKTRSGARTVKERDLLQELRRGSRSLGKELADLFHTDDE